jgi:hypothetical protein
MNTPPKQKGETYISTDIEADGPIPGDFSMLSLGAVALTSDGEEISSFSINLEELEGASQDPHTMGLWKSQPEAWRACREGMVAPKLAMQRYDSWVRRQPGRPVFVAYPLLFDMMFVYWYLIRFVGSSPFSHSGIDIKTMAYIAMGGDNYRGATKRNMPGHWSPRDKKHSHIAIDDAREQGALFLNILRELKGE